MECVWVCCHLVYCLFKTCHLISLPQVSRFLSHTISMLPMGFGAAEATSLGFVCFVVINPRVFSANRVDLGFFCFIIFQFYWIMFVLFFSTLVCFPNALPTGLILFLYANILHWNILRFNPPPPPRSTSTLKLASACRSLHNSPNSRKPPRVSSFLSRYELTSI